MKFENIELDPSKNPAVLDTATWDASQAWSAISSVGESYWKAIETAAREKRRLPEGQCCRVYAGSTARHRDSSFLLAELDDGQHVFVDVQPQQIRISVDSTDTGELPFERVEWNAAGRIGVELHGVASAENGRVAAAAAIEPRELALLARWAVGLFAESAEINLPEAVFP